MKKQRVDWTIEEEKRLIEAVIKARIAHPGPSLLQIIKSSQEQIFEPDRRRVIPSAISINRLYDRIVARCRQVEWEPELEPEPQQTNLVDRLEKLETYFVQISDQLQSHQTTVANKIEGVRSRIDALEKNSKNGLIRLGLAGLLKAQYNLLSSELSHLAKLYYIDIDQSQVSLPSTIDYVISSQKIKHRHSELFKAKYGHEKVILVEGIIESFRAKITELAKRA